MFIMKEEDSMKKLKLGAACMAAVMTVSLALTGCGGASSTSQPASSTAPSSTSASSTAPVEGADWLVPFDETVTLDVVVGWDADPSVKEGTTPETNALVEVAKDLLNIELNFLWMVPNDQLQEKLALQISSGEIPDIVMLQSADFYEFMDSDYLRDLTDAYNTYASDDLRSAVEGFGDAAIEYSSRDGKLYGIPAQLDTAESVAGLYYRSDILEAAGLSVPTNTQEMNDMLVALAQAGAEANGGKDTAGLGTTSDVLNTNFALSAYFQCYGAYPNKWIMRDGQLVNGIVQDEMLDALNGLKDLYDRGALAPDFATWNSDQFTERELLQRYPAPRSVLAKTLLQLSADGLIEKRKGHGWQFAPSLENREALNESYRFRMTIECAGLLEPSFKLDRDALARMRAAHETLIQRDDDREETVKNRLDVYHKQTAVLIGFYSQLTGDNAPRYIKIDGTQPVEAVKAAVLSALGK